METAVESTTVQAREMNPWKRRYWTRGRILRRLLLLFLLYLGLGGLIAWETVKAKSEKIVASPAQYHLPFERVTFASADGTRLAGWFLPAEKRARGVIILCHGVDST